ncbi:hypothetical protein QBC38DRAFT_362534 [Podospora fimiseda]|uniref:Uncharacterized protein n=1 Tax=Podospora fimiseda TaxID=252190 RepID=A0AAN7BRE7_9PEZI|nr:hypothetical protein QBC38DRAFT_362534 [Podospora fimiseda]
MDWAKDQYNKQYEKWVPWLEDMYLYYFTKDNKTSYATRQNLDKTKFTGVKQVDNLQDGVHNLVAGQVGQDGLGRPVGDLVSKEGVNRVERKGKDDEGGYLPAAGGPVSKGGDAVLGGVVEGVGAAGEGVKKAGGWLGLGGKGREK